MGEKDPRLPLGRFPYDEIKAAIVKHPATVPQPVDRHQFFLSEEWLISYLARLVADWSPVASPRERVEARLWRTDLRRPKAVSFRVRYNLSCLFSRLASLAHERSDDLSMSRYLAIAELQLEHALFSLEEGRRNDLVSWADTDPGLSGLRSKRASEVAGIVARWGPRDRQAMEPLERSDAIRGVSYDADTEEMELVFADGSRYRYLGVSKATHESLIEAASPGDYFNEQIRGRHPTIRL